MELLYTIIIGLVIGAVAKLVMPGKDPGNWIVTILLGIAGSFVGTIIGKAPNFYEEGEAAGFLMSVIGAVILLALYRLMFNRSPKSVA
ncbi:MAG: GlsB/YeaQ/YmgE family stress response membrane protein [Candidatus Eisenbacteria bacterium]|nr:GlsB/YeaQ/YmgE family stress response membrane protein [Candidatus Eisenbacteria bacterium]